MFNNSKEAFMAATNYKLDPKITINISKMNQVLKRNLNAMKTNLTPCNRALFGTYSFAYQMTKEYLDFRLNNYPRLKQKLVLF